METIETINILGNAWRGYTFEGYTAADFARDAGAVATLAAEALADAAISAIFADRSHCEVTFAFDGAADDTFAVAIENHAARRRVDDALRAWEMEAGVRSSFVTASCPWRVIRAEDGRYIVGRAPVRVGDAS